MFPEFDFDAPDEHRLYCRDIATAMVERHGLPYDEAVAIIRRHWSWQDHYGEHNWLIFHEEPENWADHLFRLQQDPDFWIDRDPLPRRD
ncbi:hypothetical protein SAMN05421748_12937 [Paractinoplanes atraurantiacus]|uniref:Uncharacterized protein n=2 Tax=Paractinoplanes atraurantiacus TaxID=1036182 RepID=A0A285K135_9ACTN|nr:hypothetical protein SAMN05421748_12937 [Actinoplanes atraurantiacus]